MAVVWDYLRQVSLSVIDKLLLGAAALWVAHRLNRRIEDFRARRALEGEFLRERTRRLDEVYTLMLDLEDASHVYIAEERELMVARKKSVNLSTPFARDAAEKKFSELGAELGRKAARYRPWIGNALAKLCGEYEDVVQHVADEETIDGTRDNNRIDQFAQRTAALQAAIVAEIRAGGPVADAGSKK